MKQTKQNKKRKYLLQIPKPSHNFKLLSKIFGLAICTIAMVWVLIKLLFPLLVFIINMFFSLLELYLSSSNELITFFGGIFFLIFLWKVLEELYAIWFKIMSFLINEVRK